MGLSSGDAMAFCGPAGAMAFTQVYGRNPTVAEAKQHMGVWSDGTVDRRPRLFVGL